MKTILKLIPVFLLCLGLGFYLDRKDPAPAFEIKDLSQELSLAPALEYSGAILVNLDETPDLELILTSLHGKNLSLKHDGTGFRRLNLQAIDQSGDRVVGSIACDLTGDGRDEIFFLGSPSKLFNYQRGQWHGEVLSSSPSDGKSVTCVDRTGDGKYGLIIVSENSPISFLELHDSKIVDVASKIGFGKSIHSSSVVAIPGINGQTNIMIGTDMANLFYINDGKGIFHEASDKLGVRDAEYQTRGFTPADLNHDELPDLVYGNHLGPLRFLIQNRDGSWSNDTPDIVQNEYAVNSPIFADLNLDGIDDLYLNNIRNANILYTKASENWRQLEAGLIKESDRYGIGTLLADLDQKPGLELLNTHGDGKAFTPTLYHIAPVGSWVAIDVRLPHGGPARGATVRLKTSKRDVLRVIDSGSGNFANQSPEITFGLQKDELPLGLEIRLPSGEVIRPRTALRLNQTHLIRL